ncbi:uncharacterized protein PFL1_05045 [Pseudozyma flocculosa PF-1]|uniref:Related to DUF803 domain membrane protein n=2 Tax=Pseudozyma flocculosa TaxID=84751 RepID=A0A5C3EUU0_9BASI|nr:uncharacterized protein PFL1_05045 [Pseudozyma flocculosa PF-1]EPQ27507.1 hypothetical protein PFL1_05045 [Pseudozyma flocculosa PF-1]SPO36058.1 related to DUF803 domain membrane protein [Pseudozyma flocculosa]
MPSPYNADRTNFSGSQSQLPDDQMSGFSSLTRDKWIGLTLAISSSLAIGTSFIITKKGLMDAADRGSGLASDGHTYLQNPIWWAGMATMIVGEVANFAAYTFAPPILVTPLGALSVLIGAVLASFILKEELGRLGRVGCGLCLVGTVIIVVNAPEDKEIQTVDEMLNYALQPGFMFYCLFVLAFALFMIFRMVPKYGRKTPLVYISICSLVGSISVMSVKGLGVALKLTFDGNNQFSHPSTYCFLIVVVVCILTQMNYFNKALDQFNTNVVNPIYYVTFTTSTLLASFLLFRGFNTSGAAPAVSLLGGFLVIFAGVYLLNLNRLIDPVTQQPRMSLMTGEGTTRYSEHQERLLAEHGRSRHSLGGGGGGGSNRASFSGGHGVSAPRRSSVYGNHHHGRRDSAGSSVLFNAYENEEALGLTRLDEDSDEATSASSPMLRQGTPNGKPHASFNGAPPRRVRTPNNGAPHVNGARDPSVTSKQQKRRSLIDDVQED